jgi:hypothetical protein
MVKVTDVRKKQALTPGAHIHLEENKVWATQYIMQYIRLRFPSAAVSIPLQGLIAILYI